MLACESQELIRSRDSHANIGTRIGTLAPHGSPARERHRTIRPDDAAALSGASESAPRILVRSFAGVRRDGYVHQDDGHWMRPMNFTTVSCSPSPGELSQLRPHHCPAVSTMLAFKRHEPRLTGSRRRAGKSTVPCTDVLGWPCRRRSPIAGELGV